MSAQPFDREAASPVPWAEARRWLQEADTYWLATLRPDDWPHVRPVLAVWADDALHFCTSPSSRKGRNLARDARCSIAAGTDALDLVVEGEASKVGDEVRLQRVAAAYASEYGWQTEVRDAALHGEGAPTAGPPPYEVYEVRPTTTFGFARDESVSSTRWRFSRSEQA